MRREQRGKEGDRKIESRNKLGFDFEEKIEFKYSYTIVMEY